MTNAEMAKLLLFIQDKEREVRDQGQREYADLDNCFANFDADSQHGVDRIQSIMTHATKHWRGINAWVKTRQDQRDDIRGRIKDLRMYLALLWAAINEEEDKQMDLGG